MPARIARFHSPPWQERGRRSRGFAPHSPRVEAGQGVFTPTLILSASQLVKTSNLETAFGTLVCQGSSGDRALRLGSLVKFELAGRKRRKWKNMRCSASCSHSY